jgi:hypothetical protein
MGVSEAIKALETFGPYAIVVFLGIAYIRKDKQYSDLMNKVTTLIEQKTIADIKLESAMSGLRDVIMILTSKLE